MESWNIHFESKKGNNEDNTTKQSNDVVYRLLLRGYILFKKMFY